MTRIRSIVVLGVLVACLAGCIKVPPQIAQAHTNEANILRSLHQSHMAMVDAYIDQKLVVFENFYFKEYGPAFRKHWMENFSEVHGRPYELDRDFHLFHNDLVASYLLEVAPIEELRRELRESIAREYRNATEIHEAVDRWIVSAEKLNEAQRTAMNQLLGSIRPGFSLNTIDGKITELKQTVQTKIDALTE